MGSCALFGAGSGDWGYRERERDRRENVAVLYGEELDRGRRATMWVSAHHPPFQYVSWLYSVR